MITIELTEADWEELLTAPQPAELACTCSVSVELRRVLARDGHQLHDDSRLAALRRCWNRYLVWHEIDPAGALARFAAQAGLPSEALSPPPGTQV